MSPKANPKAARRKSSKNATPPHRNGRLSRKIAHQPRVHDLDRGYSTLSLDDILDARDEYHVHLMRHPNVVATAIGYYRIRRGDSWPQDKRQFKGTGVRRLTNSEVRPYSWPAVLVFVQDWIAANEFGKGGDHETEEMVPKTLYLRDGRLVPVCVIEAPRDPKGAPELESIRYPLNNIGSGHPVIIRTQKREHLATIACLVGDGHKTYALTNRHVTGDVGEVIYSQLNGRDERIGGSTSLQARRVAFSELHPDWSGRGTFVNMDAGLIEIDDLNRWTAKLPDGTIPGFMFDVSAAGFSIAYRSLRARLRLGQPLDVW